MGNVYLTNVELTKDVRCFAKGYALEFKTPVTLLVGEIGCGKSTFLDLIREHYGLEDHSLMRDSFKESINVEEKEKLDQKRVKYFDCHGDDMRFATRLGQNISSQVKAMKQSSGQGVLIQLLESDVTSATNSLILLDEIGRGTSPRRQEGMKYFLNKLVEKGNQIIASTHSERIMDYSKNAEMCSLYSMEHRAYMDVDEFLFRHIYS